MAYNQGAKLKRNQHSGDAVDALAAITPLGTIDINAGTPAEPTEAEVTAGLQQIADQVDAILAALKD